MDATSFREIMEALKPSSKVKLVTSNLKYLLQKVRNCMSIGWNALRNKEEYIINKDEKYID